MDKKVSKSARQRSKGIKIRRLGETTDKPHSKSYSTKIVKLLKLISLTLPLAFAIFCFLNGTPLMQFVNCYRQQYHNIIYDSCKPDINTKDLMHKINMHGILHQTDALQSLQHILSNNSKLTSIAFVGKPGVGKSLVANALADSFPWHTNVLHYHWNTQVETEVEKMQMLRHFFNRLADCGRNLLIIDNLAPCEKEIVSISHKFYKMMQTAESEKYLIMLFIFTLSTMEYNDTTLHTQYVALQQLPNTLTIKFKDFETKDVSDCIKREAVLENITLSAATEQQVLAAINPQLNGCKNVRAKVLMYAKYAE